MALGGQAADAARKAYALSAADASVALRQVAEQAGVELVYSAEAVRGVRTNAINGEFTALEAVNRLIANTDLSAVQDAKTGAIAVNRLEAAGKPAPAPGSVRADDGSLLLDKIEVSASRVDGLNNQTIFQTDGQGALAYDVISRQDIERMGVTSVEELFRFIPQTSDYGSNALQGGVTNSATVGTGLYQSSEVKLRGFSSLQTSILINGRRLQRGSLSNGPDLNRIPTAAIERIEILPSSASAVYGGGAIGGAINIILRKDYTGRDLTFSYGTSTEGGAERYQVTYFEGRTFNEGRTQFSFTVDYQKSEPLYAGERDYLDNALARYPADTTATVNGRSVYEQYILQAFAGMPATIRITAATGALPIPGATGARYASVPTGQDGTALTPGSFVGTAGTANLGDRYKRSLLYSPGDRYNFTSQLEHEFIADKLSLYAELGTSYFRSQYEFPQNVALLSLAATHPFNPFRTNVTPGFVGVPVTVYYDPVDLPDPSLFLENNSARALLGFKGKLNDNWEWTLDGTGEYGRSHSSGENPTQNLNTFLTSTAATAGLTLAQRWALYNPLADHRAFPRGDVMADFLKYSRQYTFYSNLSQVNLRVVGDLLEVPAGPVEVSAGGEVIWSEYKTRTTISVSDAMRAAVPVAGNANTATQQARRTQSYFFEGAMPLIGPKWRPLPLEAVDLNFGLRWETTDDSTDETSPVVALRVAPTKDIAFRVSYAEGFFPPDQSHYEGGRINDAAFTPFDDNFRGGTFSNYQRTEISGGNSDLRPETSTAWNYGIIFTPRFAPGLTLTVDYWDIEKLDAVRTTFPEEVVNNPDLFPGRVVRAAPSATDIANGWLGEVTSIDWRPINVGITRTDGIDFKARYTRDIADLGTFTYFGVATWTNSFRDQVFVTNPWVERVNSSGSPLRWRGNSSIFWEKNRWTAGVTATYINSYHANTTTPSAVYPTGNGLDGDRIASATLWDLQVSYHVPAGRGIDRGWQSWLNDTKWTLGVRNVFDKEPAFRTDIYSYYSRYEDPRQRYVTLSVRKSL